MGLKRELSHHFLDYKSEQYIKFNSFKNVQFNDLRPKTLSHKVLYIFETLPEPCECEVPDWSIQVLLSTVSGDSEQRLA